MKVSNEWEDVLQLLLRTRVEISYGDSAFVRIENNETVGVPVFKITLPERASNKLEQLYLLMHERGHIELGSFTAYARNKDVSIETLNVGEDIIVDRELGRKYEGYKIGAEMVISKVREKAKSNRVLRLLIDAIEGAKCEEEREIFEMADRIAKQRLAGVSQVDWAYYSEYINKIVKYISNHNNSNGNDDNENEKSSKKQGKKNNNSDGGSGNSSDSDSDSKDNNNSSDSDSDSNSNNGSGDDSENSNSNSGSKNDYSKVLKEAVGKIGLKHDESLRKVPSLIPGTKIEKVVMKEVSEVGDYNFSEQLRKLILAGKSYDYGGLRMDINRYIQSRTAQVPLFKMNKGKENIKGKKFFIYLDASGSTNEYVPHGKILVETVLFKIAEGLASSLSGLGAVVLKRTFTTFIVEGFHPWGSGGTFLGKRELKQIEKESKEGQIIIVTDGVIEFENMNIVNKIFMLSLTNGGRNRKYPDYVVNVNVEANEESIKKGVSKIVEEIVKRWAR